MVVAINIKFKSVSGKVIEGMLNQFHKTEYILSKVPGFVISNQKQVLPVATRAALEILASAPDMDYTMLSVWGDDYKLSLKMLADLIEALPEVNLEPNGELNMALIVRIGEEATEPLAYATHQEGVVVPNYKGKWG